LTDGPPDHRQLRSDSPPTAAEDIHLPGPSYLPIVVAAGLTVALVGIVVSFVAFVIGMVVWVVAALIWVRDTRQEMAELPLERG
jgi:hypothetical protein